MTGAIFCDTRPATIIRSDWRGEPRKTSAPKRAMSKRLALIDIISMAQQARPKLIGQIDDFRAQFTALSSWANMIPSQPAPPALSAVEGLISAGPDSPALSAVEGPPASFVCASPMRVFYTLDRKS